MHLKIYPISENIFENGVPWDMFLEAFSDFEIIKDPKDTYDGRLILQRPLQDIHIYNAIRFY